MSIAWEEDSRYTNINLQSCKQANEVSLEETGLPIPEYALNNRARESLNGVFGLLTGRFDTFATGPNAYLTQTEALAEVHGPVWTIPAWELGEDYEEEDESEYLGIQYVCIQDHSSQIGSEPPNAPAFWTAL